MSAQRLCNGLVLTNGIGKFLVRVRERENFGGMFLLWRGLCFTIKIAVT